jgi:hypothetical protein
VRRAIDPGAQHARRTLRRGRGRTLIVLRRSAGRSAPSPSATPATRAARAVVVDEEIYRLLPTLLIATVDKFAQMPWKGAVQMLFGQVTATARATASLARRLTRLAPPEARRAPGDEAHDHGPAASAGPHHPGRAAPHQRAPRHADGPLRDGHRRALLVGRRGHARAPQGGRLDGDHPPRRRPGLSGLFLRDVQVFPPQGLDARDNFFAVQRPPSASAPGPRRYLGICAPGTAPQGALIRVYVAAMAAAQVLYERNGGTPTRG